MAVRALLSTAFCTVIMFTLLNARHARVPGGRRGARARKVMCAAVAVTPRPQMHSSSLLSVSVQGSPVESSCLPGCGHGALSLPTHHWRQPR